jgi:plasmid stabilization system protein ParE
MTSRFVFTEEAETQLLEILDYLADEGQSAAVRVRDAIYDAVGKLAERPGIGHTREDLTDRPLRFWTVYAYLLVYDPASRPLTIVAVLHSARDVELLLRRSERVRELCLTLEGDVSRHCSLPEVSAGASGTHGVPAYGRHARAAPMVAGIEDVSTYLR